MAKKGHDSKITFDFSNPRIKVLINNTDHYLLEKSESQIEDFLELKLKLTKLLKSSLKSLKFFAKPAVEIFLPVGFSAIQEDELIEVFKKLGVVNIVISSSIVNEAKLKEIPIEAKEPTVLVIIRFNKAEIAILSSNKIVSSEVIKDLDAYDKVEDKLIERLKNIIGKNLKDYNRGVVFMGETDFISRQREFFTKTLNLPVILLDS